MVTDSDGVVGRGAEGATSHGPGAGGAPRAAAPSGEGSNAAAPNGGGSSAGVSGSGGSNARVSGSEDANAAAPSGDGPGSAASGTAVPTSAGTDGTPADRSVSVLVLQLDPADPPLRLATWLTGAGAALTVIPAYAEGEIPDSTAGFDALLVLGGALGSYDDDRAPWLARVRALLARSVADSSPTLTIGLGAQLLAAATGGRVQPAARYRLGARLAAKRDVTEEDLLLGRVPITPDVMQFRRDTIAALPGGSVLLLASPDDAVEAFRVGSAAWGLQFHIETTADVLRSWRDDPARGLTDDERTESERRFGAVLDEAEQMMAGSWRAIAQRFVELVRQGIPQTPTGHHAPRLPIVASELGG